MNPTPGMCSRFSCLCIFFLLTCAHNTWAITTVHQTQRAALRAAVSDLMERFPDDYPQGAAFLAALDGYEGKPLSAGDLARFSALQREALLANPLLSDKPLLFVARRQYKPDHHNTATLFQTGEINTASFEGGSALKLVDFQHGGVVRTLLEAPEGIIRDPVVHFDGDRILFSMRRDIEDDYSLYEINSDGTGLRPLTFAQGVSDIDPLYLPCGAIVFSSTREPKYCMCNRHIMCNLFRMSGDGTNIHQIGRSTLFEGHGTLMPDGRILYYRWEYVDRNFGDAQGLWTTYPDGTNHAVYWGNNTQSPGAVINARPIPGTHQVICVFSSCHDRPWGALAIIDRRLGVDGVAEGNRSPSVLRTWPADAIEMVGENDWDRFNWDTFMKVSPKYEDPFPLSDVHFLCSRTTGTGEITGIYLVDLFGNEILIHAEGDEPAAMGCYDPMPLGSSPRPPVLPDRRDFDNATGLFYVADVYRGTHMAGVAPGAVRSLRVVASPEKRSYTHPSWDGQGQQAPGMSWHDFNNKRILGVVPVEEDGSAYFSAPSDTFLYFQILDEQGMMIHSMRSGTVVQSGEVQGCVGCHEDRLSAVPLSRAPTIEALTRPPSVLSGAQEPGPNFDYMRDVQPVFDRHCVRCHDYGQDAGAVLNLAGDRDLMFNTSYNELWRKKYVNAIGAGPAQIQQAYTWGARASKLTHFLLEPCPNVALDTDSMERIVTWMDINAPYYGEYESAYPDNPGGRSPLDHARIQRLTELTGVDLIAQLAHHKNTGPQITFERPELSPCLEGLEQRDPEGWREAVDIIRVGAETLNARPRADMDGFRASPEDQRRLRKYDRRHAVEMRNRAAMGTGKKIGDEK